MRPKSPQRIFVVLPSKHTQLGFHCKENCADRFQDIAKHAGLCEEEGWYILWSAVFNACKGKQNTSRVIQADIRLQENW